MIAYRIQDRKRGTEYLIDRVEEDYTLTYSQLVEIGAEWLAENN